jgi:hypothetical protein
MSANQPVARNSSAAADLYRVHVRGHLDDGWSDWLDGFAVERHDDGTTVLVGPVVDQAALHGLLARIRDLGLPLLAVNREDGSDDGTSWDVQRDGARQTEGGTR